MGKRAGPTPPLAGALSAAAFNHRPRGTLRSDDDRRHVNRFSSSAAVVIASGASAARGCLHPATQALAVTALGLAGPLRRRVEQAGRRVAQGLALSAALAGVELNAEVLQTLRQGEQLGQAAPALERATTHYKRAIDKHYANLSQALGIAMLLIGAGVLVGVGLTIFMPLYAGLGSLSLTGQ